jgi:hypothetical protein
LVKYISELDAAQIEEYYKVRPHCGFITASNVKATDRSFWDTVFLCHQHIGRFLYVLREAVYRGAYATTELN